VSRKPAPAPLADPDVPQGMSIALLKDLHLLTRDGHLNADARRKLKQIRHLVGLLRPALDDAYARHPDPRVVDCGAGKSYLGFLLYELVVGPAQRGRVVSIESRPELVADASRRAQSFGHQRFHFVNADIAAASVHDDPVQVVVALHACDTATDDALALGIAAGADHLAVVPCCQAELARQLAEPATRDPLDEALIHHPLHRREFGSSLTNVIRGLCLQAHGYKVTVTELVGWEHSLKNELILARRVRRTDVAARDTLAGLLARWAVRPALIDKLIASGHSPLPSAPVSPAKA